MKIGRYKHYKGKEYTVLGVAQHSETKEELVVYREEYGAHRLWVRPLAMFTEAVDGVLRFQFIGSTMVCCNCGAVFHGNRDKVAKITVYGRGFFGSQEEPLCLSCVQKFNAERPQQIEIQEGAYVS